MAALQIGDQWVWKRCSIACADGMVDATRNLYYYPRVDAPGGIRLASEQKLRDFRVYDAFDDSPPGFEIAAGIDGTLRVDSIGWPPIIQRACQNLMSIPSAAGPRLVGSAQILASDLNDGPNSGYAAPAPDYGDYPGPDTLPSAGDRFSDTSYVGDLLFIEFNNHVVWAGEAFVFIISVLQLDPMGNFSRQPGRASVRLIGHGNDPTRP